MQRIGVHVVFISAFLPFSLFSTMYKYMFLFITAFLLFLLQLSIQVQLSLATTLASAFQLFLLFQHGGQVHVQPSVSAFQLFLLLQQDVQVHFFFGGTKHRYTSFLGAAFQSNGPSAPTIQHSSGYRVMFLIPGLLVFMTAHFHVSLQVCSLLELIPRLHWITSWQDTAVSPLVHGGSGGALSENLEQQRSSCNRSSKYAWLAMEIFSIPDPVPDTISTSF